MSWSVRKLKLPKGDKLMESRTYTSKETTTARTISRLRKLTITILAAVTVAIGSLTSVPAASAMPRSCDQVQGLVNGYYAIGMAYYAVGMYNQAFYYFGKSEGLAAGGCRG